MAMPPPLHPEFEREEDSPCDIREVIGKKIKKLGLADYLDAIGAGLIAFREARERRWSKDFESEERD